MVGKRLERFHPVGALAGTLFPRAAGPSHGAVVRRVGVVRGLVHLHQTDTFVEQALNAIGTALGHGLMFFGAVEEENNRGDVVPGFGLGWPVERQHGRHVRGAGH